MESKKEIEKINECISKLVYDKSTIRKAYNYYHGIRDLEQFKHIEENYGLGVPTSISFTPLIKKHIDVLVGEYLELDPDMQITCKDDRTISNIMRDKKLKIDKALYDYLTKYLKNSIINIITGSEKPINDPFVEKEMQKIKADIDNAFVSEYEIAAQNILSYIQHSRDIDLKNKMRELYTDLLISGTLYYRVRPTNDETNIRFEALNPVDTFIERNQNSFYLNKSPRAVIRKYMTVEEILLEYGSELTQEAKARLKRDNRSESFRNDNSIYVNVDSSLVYDENEEKTKLAKIPAAGILGGLEVSPLAPFETAYNEMNRETFTVYECEWLEWDKANDRLTRHEGIKIGGEIYICRGESKNIIRSQSNPKDCSLTINGMFFSDKNGMPFSLMISTMDLQDKYDLLIYYRDNLIATSGTVGDWIDLAHIPSALGVELPQRLEKWLAYKKNGLALFDSSQEGANLINTTFNGFDDTVKAQSIQAIQLAIDSVEMNASAMTGVFPEKLGGIQERDAVSNVKVGIRYSTLLTKQYFTAMDLMFKEINYDALNTAKIVYKNGLTGTIILGPKLVKTFTALPEYYTVTDFDIHIQDSTESFKTKEEIKALNVELIKAGLVDTDMVINIMTAKNITELKKYIERAMASKKAENDMVSQLQQQLEQATQQTKELQKQMKEVNSENQKLQKQLNDNNNIKWEIEKKRLLLEEKEIRDKKDYNDQLIKTKEEQLRVELAQTMDNNPYNDEIKNI